MGLEQGGTSSACRHPPRPLQRAMTYLRSTRTRSLRVDWSSVLTRIHTDRRPADRDVGHVERRVIALKGSPRLPRFYTQDSARSFVAFDAVDTRDGSVPAEFDISAFVRRYERLPLPGEVGCTLSHLAVMRDFLAGAKDGDLLVVAEDDAQLSPHFDADLPTVIRSATKSDIIILANSMSTMDGPSYDRGAKWLTISPIGRVLVRLLPRPRFRWISLVETTADLGTICYLVSVRAALLLVSHADNGVSWVADDYRIPLELGLRTYHVRPYLAQQNPSEHSIIRQHAEQPLTADTSWRGRIRFRSRFRKLAPSLELAVRDLRDRRSFPPPTRDEP